MKYLCSSCDRLVEPSAVIPVSGGALELRCPACQARQHLEPTTPSVALPPDDAEDREQEPGEASCPKCGAPRAKADACPRCGLVYNRWTGDPAPPPASLEARWRELTERWDDEVAHDRFISAALEAGALAFAARCYNSRDDQRAREQLDKITRLGVQAMQLAEEPGRLDPRVIRLIGWVLFALLCLSMAGFAFFVTR